MAGRLWACLLAFQAEDLRVSPAGCGAHLGNSPHPSHTDGTQSSRTSGAGLCGHIPDPCRPRGWWAPNRCPRRPQPSHLRFEGGAQTSEGDWDELLGSKAAGRLMTQGVNIPAWWELLIKAQMLQMPGPPPSPPRAAPPTAGRRVGPCLGIRPLSPEQKIHQER